MSELTYRVESDEVSDRDLAAGWCSAVREDPRYLDEKITAVATPRDLMGGPPPSRFRPFARRRWFARLRRRAEAELRDHATWGRMLQIIAPC